jgi:alkylation response protein AidB-like acyl-CoA dehydrogenase
MPEELLERTRRLGHETFAPVAAEGTPGRLNRPLMKALGDEGLLELALLGSATELCALREGLAHGCIEAETALALQGLGGHPILRSSLRDEWMPRLASGERVAAFALSEPDAGSDAAALALRAEEDGEGYRLTGTKMWISNAPEADVYAVFARTGEPGPRGVTGFVVPRESEGLTGEPIELIAPHAVGRLDFDGVRADRDQVIRKASAMAKLFATEAAQKAVDVAIQVHGARALEQGHLLEHLYREVRAPRIYEGASEVQREIIARELFR